MYHTRGPHIGECHDLSHDLTVSIRVSRPESHEEPISPGIQSYSAMFCGSYGSSKILSFGLKKTYHGHFNILSYLLCVRQKFANLFAELDSLASATTLFACFSQIRRLDSNMVPNPRLGVSCYCPGARSSVAKLLTYDQNRHVLLGLLVNCLRRPRISTKATYCTLHREPRPPLP